MHNFVYLAQWRSQEFSHEPNFGVMMMMMILLVWQPIGWISYKVQCKLQKKEK